MDTRETQSVIGTQYLIDKPILNGLGTCKRKCNKSDLHRQTGPCCIEHQRLYRIQACSDEKGRGNQPPAKLPMA